MAVPMVGAVVPLVFADVKRDQYKEEINRHISARVKELDADEEKLREYLKKMLEVN